MAESDPKPLAGLRVLVTRAAGRADKLAIRLRALGAEPLLRPTIAHAPPDDPEALAEALGRLEAGVYEWLLLTSVTAVEVVAHGLEGRAPQLGGRVSLRIGAVGPTTATACRELLGVEAVAMPERFVGEELARSIGDPVGRRVLLPNADLARPTLEERLRDAGALVDRVVAYKTVPAQGGAELTAILAAGSLSAIMFTSGSTARFFAQHVGEMGLAAARHMVIACIGPATAEVCREIGLEPTVVATVSTEEGLVEALVDYYVRR